MKFQFTIKKIIALSIPISFGGFTVGSLVTKNYFETHYYNKYVQEVKELRDDKRRFVPDTEREGAFKETTTIELDSIAALEKKDQRWKEGRRK